jgi:hypothetical protein
MHSHWVLMVEPVEFALVTWIGCIDAVALTLVVFDSVYIVVFCKWQGLSMWSVLTGDEKLGSRASAIE